MNTQALKNYSAPMRALIQSHTSDAVEFVKEMINDDDRDEYTGKQIIDMIAGAAVDFIAQDLDVDRGDPSIVPKTMQEAIEEFVRDNFKFSFKLG